MQSTTRKELDIFQCFDLFSARKNHAIYTFTRDLFVSHLHRRYVQKLPFVYFIDEFFLFRGENDYVASLKRFFFSITSANKNCCGDNISLAPVITIIVVVTIRPLLIGFTNCEVLDPKTIQPQCEWIAVGGFVGKALRSCWWIFIRRDQIDIVVL